MKVDPISERDMVIRAGRGLGKIDLWGLRGATMLTLEEVEAMALCLAALGLKPIGPKDPDPENANLPKVGPPGDSGSAAESDASVEA